MSKLRFILSAMLFLSCAKPLLAADEFVFFQAYVRGNSPASPGMIIPFTAGHQVGNNWQNEGFSFVAPVLGYYHFDVTTLISVTSLNLTCPIQVQLIHESDVVKRHPLYELRIHSTNVANTPNAFSWRPSGQLTRASGGVNLLMHPGNRVYVKLTGGGSSCYDGFTVQGSTSNNEYGSFISGYLIKSYEDSQINIPSPSAPANSDSTLIEPSNQNVENPQTTTRPSNSVDQKRTYDLYVSAPGNNKIQLIKKIRTVTGASLKEAKKMLSHLDQPIVTNKTKKEALALAKEFESIGVKTVITKH